MYLLDSDMLTHLYAGHPKVEQKIRESTDPDIGTTIISKLEMLRGRIEFLLKATEQDLLRAQELLQRTEAFLAGVLVVPLGTLAVNEFRRLRHAKAVRSIGRADLLIASIALSRRATLVTRNLRHFRRVPNLLLENWLD
jgi:tRNA(fMet)-specific endonuclease VapC